MLNSDSYSFHLYDAWADMKSEKLLPKEKGIIGGYSNLERYQDTKNIIKEFLHPKSGTLLKFPTGQAIFFKN